MNKKQAENKLFWSTVLWIGLILSTLFGFVLVYILGYQVPKDREKYKNKIIAELYKDIPIYYIHIGNTGWYENYITFGYKIGNDKKGDYIKFTDINSGEQIYTLNWGEAYLSICKFKDILSLANWTTKDIIYHKGNKIIINWSKNFFDLTLNKNGKNLYLIEDCLEKVGHKPEQKLYIRYPEYGFNLIKQSSYLLFIGNQGKPHTFSDVDGYINEIKRHKGTILNAFMKEKR